MGRGGRDKVRDGPERRCIATGRTAPAEGLIRFVVGPDGIVLPDIAGKLPGRGLWVSADRGAIDRAVAKRLFSRAAKAQVTAPPDLADRAEAALLRRVVELISLARKAGEAVSGYEKVRGWLDEGRAAVLIQAADGSARGKSKLRPPEAGAFIGCLTARELGLSFGRDRAIHAALGAGGLTARIVEDANRLAGLRAQGGEVSPERTIGSHERQ
jgi:predicted RNA-binding protein YlxR (DUF448 family)